MNAGPNAYALLQDIERLGLDRTPDIKVMKNKLLAGVVHEDQAK